MSNYPDILNFLNTHIPVQGGWIYRNKKITGRIENLKIQESLRDSPTLSVDQKLISRDAGKLFAIENHLIKSGLINWAEFNKTVQVRYKMLRDTVTVIIDIDPQGINLERALFQVENKDNKTLPAFIPSSEEIRAIRELVIASCGTQSRDLYFTYVNWDKASQALQEVEKTIIESGALKEGEFSLRIKKEPRTNQKTKQPTYSYCIKVDILSHPVIAAAYDYVYQKYYGNYGNKNERKKPDHVLPPAKGC